MSSQVFYYNITRNDFLLGFFLNKDDIDGLLLFWYLSNGGDMDYINCGSYTVKLEQN